MNENDNKTIVRRSFEDLFSRGDLDVADQIFAESYVGHDPSMPEDLHGPEELKDFVRMYRSAFPDLVLTVEDQIAEGDRVVTRFTARGTHEGDLMGIPPTGRQVTISGISIDRLEDGKSVESWTSYDVMGMFRQLGVVSAEGPARQRAAASPAPLH